MEVKVMAERQITKKEKGFLIKYPGTKGQTFYGGSSILKDLSFQYADGLFKKQNHYIRVLQNNG